jgi:hypothetical protein
VQLPILVERVYVLGTGERAQRVVHGLRQNPEIGVEVASWTGKLEGAVTRESVAAHLMEVVNKQKVHRVIVAMPDRRGTIPMQELLVLRMRGVKIEEATSWLEKISGKIEVDNLYPSWLVFSEGFRRSTSFIVVRRLLSIGISLIGLILAAPLLPLIMLAIRLDSRGPVFYTQTRVGKAGRHFKVVKFRTMRQDAEAANGPQWAGDNDPRITRVGASSKVTWPSLGRGPNVLSSSSGCRRKFRTTACDTWCVRDSRGGRRSGTSMEAPLKTRAKSSSTTCTTSRTHPSVSIS